MERSKGRDWSRHVGRVSCGVSEGSPQRWFRFELRSHVSGIVVSCGKQRALYSATSGSAVGRTSYKGGPTQSSLTRCRLVIGRFG